jgi:hypothetical protein
MKFPKTTEYLKKLAPIFNVNIEIIWTYTDDYSKEEILQLRDELKAEGIFTKKLRRYNRQPTTGDQ